MLLPRNLSRVKFCADSTKVLETVILRLRTEFPTHPSFSSDVYAYMSHKPVKDPAVVGHVGVRLIMETPNYKPARIKSVQIFRVLKLDTVRRKKGCFKGNIGQTVRLR